MIRFLLKGILRDKSRSLLPVLVVAIGVALTVVLSGYIKGAMGGIINQNARFQTGHLKVVTKAYAQNSSQMPVDLALLGADDLLKKLRKDFPQVKWVDRTVFAGLLDVPDSSGTTKGQGPASGIALEMLNRKSGELKRMNIESSLVRGTVPQKLGEALLSDDFANKLKLNIGDSVTYVGSTMNGSMTMKTFRMAGTVRFGNALLDKGAFLIDIADAQEMLDMENGTGEILGFLKEGVYAEEKALRIQSIFNENTDPHDEFAPTMQVLRDQNNLGDYLDTVNAYSAFFIGIFILAMSVVLWNTGLLGGLRRFQEFGIRLALGESKGRIYRSQLVEAFLIGMLGSFAGTCIGIAVTFWLQIHGFDISEYYSNSSMLMPSVIRSEFSANLLYIGFIPGLCATVFGRMLSGLGIYKRQTARLFKELEV
ncbi:MAG: ABC transporter permease [Cytophagales bacterium]|nr:ABC transporter permease [Cytophagales bacterium]